MNELQIIQSSMSNEDLTDIQEENKIPLEAKDNECQCPTTKTLTVQDIKEVFDHLDSKTQSASISSHH
jgi:hypothetical protein